MEGNVIQIESKDDLKKRLGRSTDSGDSVIYASVDTPLDFAKPAGIGGRNGKHKVKRAASRR